MIRINTLKYRKIAFFIIETILDFRILCLKSKQLFLETRMQKKLIIRLVVINL